MSIKLKYHQPAKDIQALLDETIINWNEQRLYFQLSNNKTHEHQLTEPQWNYLISGLQALMNQIPNISDIEIPDFNPDIT